jgi:hypothetical protein
MTVREKLREPLGFVTINVNLVFTAAVVSFLTEPLTLTIWPRATVSGLMLTVTVYPFAVLLPDVA